jgi:poly(3-hydroxybutyrate) depolymerase
MEITMKLIKKTLEKYNRSMYLYFPEGSPRSAFKRACITILREENTEESVKALLQNGLTAFAEKNNLILAFPNPTKQGWNYNKEEYRENDIEVLLAMQDVIGFVRELEPAVPYQGIPTYEMMMSTWHPMNDTKYIIGLGMGASMAYTLVTCAPDNIAAIWGIGGVLSEKVMEKALWEVMPAYLSEVHPRVANYFKKANAVSEEPETDGFYRNKVNPLQCVKVTEERLDITQIDKIWEELFVKVRRPNTGAHGDIEPRMVLSEAGFEFFEEDDRLQDGKKHTWFTHVPASVKTEPGKKAPLMVFMHGGSDNPEEAAEMSKFHEIGEKEGFITVYPWATNKAAWNMQLMELGGMNKDDDSYIIALIDYMIANYPVDGQRVYLSGFSNGAGMAQTVGMLHPDKIAAICHIDSNWPGNRMGPSDFDPELEKPFNIALEKQKKFPYRMPVWYTYGTREPSYPIYEKCSQQHQYDFWKRYNNVGIKPTPGKEEPHPCGCGVPGDRTEILTPCTLHPKHQYDVQRFYTKDEGHENLYNFVIMRDKGHEVARMDPELGWNYVKQFRRNPDGTVGRINETI